MGADIDHAGQGSLISPSLRNLVGVVDTVLQRQDDRPVADQRRQFCGAFFRVVGFNSEQDEIDDADLTGIIGEQSVTNVSVALGALEGQSLLPHRHQVGATRDKRNVIRCSGQSRTKVPPTAPAPITAIRTSVLLDHRNFMLSFYGVNSMGSKTLCASEEPTVPPTGA